MSNCIYCGKQFGGTQKLYGICDQCQMQGKITTIKQFKVIQKIEDYLGNTTITKYVARCTIIGWAEREKEIGFTKGEILLYIKNFNQDKMGLDIELPFEAIKEILNYCHLTIEQDTKLPEI